jgi:RNA polymerase sigma-70 factor (ECF subfamily)
LRQEKILRKLKLFFGLLRVTDYEYMSRRVKGGVRLDELRLIRSIRRNGDRAAADALIRKYYGEIYGFVRKQVRSADIALDLTQEIFISVLRTIAHFDPKGAASFRTWLYRAAVNKIVDWFRSRAYHILTETLSLDEAEPIDASDFTARLANDGFSEEIYAYLRDLPPDTQTIFRLHVFGEYTFSEIAAALVLPEGSVKSKYYRLINLLKKEFAGYE